MLRMRCGLSSERMALPLTDACLTEQQSQHFGKRRGERICPDASRYLPVDCGGAGRRAACRRSVALQE
jgi:hypothetical protein